MAAPASLSTHFSVNTPIVFSLSSSSDSSRPTNSLSLQNSCNKKFTNPLKPYSITAISFPPLLNFYRRNGFSRIIGYEHKNERRASIKPSVSAQHESQPHHRNNEDESDTNEFPVPENAADQRYQSGLKPLMHAYKTALLDGDKKTIYEIENIIYAVEKEKHELNGKVLSLSTEIISGKEKSIRLQADFDNYRKRSEKERLNVRSNAQGEVIESLLPMIDSFERAKQHLKLETEMEKKIDTSYQGIYKQFVEIMRSLRVAAVPTVGKPFDPLKHEAIAREESNEYKEGIITQELRRGFYLADRLLRPAMVKVSSGPGKIKPQPVSEQPAFVAGADS